MKVTFIGVGDATDAKPNTSILIEGETNLLLDCGYSVPTALWSYSSDQNLIDTIYISHLHADHYFGLAPLLMRMIEVQRTKAITIICPDGFETMLQQSLDLAYGNILDHRNYQIIIKTARPGENITVGEYTLTFANTNHSRDNLATRITDGVRTICYSGDGRMTEASEALFDNCDLLIHDAFHEDKPAGNAYGHESVENLLSYIQTHAIKKLAMVHVSKTIQDIKSRHQDANYFFPQSGDSITLK